MKTLYSLQSNQSASSYIVKGKVFTLLEGEITGVLPQVFPPRPRPRVLWLELCTVQDAPVLVYMLVVITQTFSL